MKFQGLNFVDDKLTAKTAKFTSLENLYVYGVSWAHMHCMGINSYRGFFKVPCGGYRRGDLTSPGV